MDEKALEPRLIITLGRVSGAYGMARRAALHWAFSRRLGRGQHVRQVEGRGRTDIRVEDGLH
jgi:hypothetical protein